jgi:clan AA aspartic protease
MIRTEIELSNPINPNLKPIKSVCLVDPGATYLCIPSHIGSQLGLKELQKREVKLADGNSSLAPYVGPIKVVFEDRLCFVGAMVLGDEVLLGAIPMEDMDLVIHPKLLKISVNPENPIVASGLAK